MRLIIAGLIVVVTACSNADAAAPPPPPPLAKSAQPWVQIELGAPIAGFTTPLFLTHAGDGSGRMFVVQQDGLVKIVDHDGRVEAVPFLDVRALLGHVGGEQGLLGMAFHPKFKDNGRVFFAYTDKNGNDAFAEVHASSSKADPNTVRVLFAIDDFAANHNGGNMIFGPDGKLYLGTGDGGGAGDPHRTAQDDTQLLGKMLRLDVDAPGAQPEKLMKGLRNPWRYSFDRATGELWIGDVGQDKWEEVDVVTPAAGLNFGWSYVEGSHCFRDCEKAAGTVTPVFEYPHGEDGCSITGGYVYRGKASPKLVGTYVVADFCSGRMWELRKSGGGYDVARALDSKIAVSSFGEDEDGEVWLVDYAGSIRKLSAR